MAAGTTPQEHKSVVATPAMDQKFERWMSDYQVLLVPIITTTATFPIRTKSATYSALPRYILTVNTDREGQL